MCAARLWWIQCAEVAVSKVLQDQGGGGYSQSNLGFQEDFLGNRRCMPAQLCLTLCNHVDCSSPGSSVHGIFPGKNTGAGCHFLLQGNFSTQEWNHISCLSCISRWILYLQTTWEALKNRISKLSLRRRQWHPTPVLLPGKSHGWRSLVCYSPWGR